MRQALTVFTLSVIVLLFCAAITANIRGHMPEMRGAWITRAFG
jgi:hypothetical protein